MFECQILLYAILFGVSWLKFQQIYFHILLAPRADRHAGATDRYLHPSHDLTIDEQHPPRTITSDIPPPLPMVSMDTTLPTITDQFSIDALAFLTNSFDTYPIYEYCFLIKAIYFDRFQLIF